MNSNIKLPYDILIELYIYKEKTLSIEEFFGYLKKHGTKKAHIFYDFNTKDMEYIYHNLEFLKEELDITFKNTSKNYDNGEKVRDFFKNKFLLKSDTLENQLKEINDLNLKVKVKQEFTDVEKISRNIYTIESKIFINTNYESSLDEYIRLTNQLDDLEFKRNKELLEKGIDLLSIYDRLDELENDIDVINYLDSDLEE